VLFVALNIYLDANLWTGDKKLINGLSKKNYKNTLSTSKLYGEYLVLKSKTANKSE